MEMGKAKEWFSLQARVIACDLYIEMMKRKKE